MSGDIFVKAQSQEVLQHFAQRLKTLLGLATMEQRDSSNYINEEYFVGMALGVDVVTALSDESDLDGYAFWIYFTTSTVWNPDSSFIDGLSDLVARHLTIAGETVVRLPAAHLAAGPKIFYELQPGAEWADRVTTREVSG